MKYIDADILKAEIEWLDKHYIVREEYDCGWNNALNAISKFLDSLPEQPEGLEEAAEEYVKTTSVKVWGRIDPKKDFKGYMARANYGTGLLDGFIAGAEWGRKQVLHEIYDGKVKPVDKITAAWLDNEQNT